MRIIQYPAMLSANVYHLFECFVFLHGEKVERSEYLQGAVIWLLDWNESFWIIRGWHDGPGHYLVPMEVRNCSNMADVIQYYVLFKASRARITLPSLSLFSSIYLLVTVRPNIPKYDAVTRRSQYSRVKRRKFYWLNLCSMLTKDPELTATCFFRDTPVV